MENNTYLYFVKKLNLEFSFVYDSEWNKPVPMHFINIPIYENTTCRCRQASDPGLKSNGQVVLDITYWLTHHRVRERRSHLLLFSPHPWWRKTLRFLLCHPGAAHPWGTRRPDCLPPWCGESWGCCSFCQQKGYVKAGLSAPTMQGELGLLVVLSKHDIDIYI